VQGNSSPETSTGGRTPLLLNCMRFYNRLLHVFLGLSLIVASLLALWIFARDVYGAVFAQHSILDGFLHALGMLLILWTVSELISTEVRYLSGQKVQVAVFVDVAIAALLRKLLIGDIEGLSMEVRLVNLAGLVALGILRWALTYSSIAQRTNVYRPRARIKRGSSPGLRRSSGR